MIYVILGAKKMDRIDWNKYEVAILIYGYYLYEKGYCSRKTF